MANVIYPLIFDAWMQASASSSMAGSGATGVYVALIDTAMYTYSASDQFYSSISAAVVGTPVELTSKTWSSSVFDAADSTFTSVSGATVEALGIYIKNAGANTTWRLVAYQDSVTGLPVTPNGTNIVVTWNGSGIFKAQG